MPRGSRPGERRGGRQKGTPNKATSARLAEIIASGLTPLQYFLEVMRDKTASDHLRLDAAKAAAPYVHPRIGQVEPPHPDPDFVPLVERLKAYTRRDLLEGGDATLHPRLRSRIGSHLNPTPSDPPANPDDA
jgi:hypothetical protein